MNNKHWLLMMAATLGLTACGGDDSDSTSNTSESDSDSSAEYSSLQINASSYSSWQYVSLTTGEVLDLDDASAASSTDWHIAFQRYNVKLNGGDSGPGSVQGAIADAQDEFYPDGEADVNVFTNAVADTEAAALSVAYDTSALTFEADANEPAMTGWYSYNYMTHAISADTDVGYLIRHADGSTYSKLFITAVDSSAISLSYNIQAADTVQFTDTDYGFSATFTDDATASDATLICLDLDSESAVDCDDSAADWELMYEYNATTHAVKIWSNGGVYGSGNAGVFGPIDATTLADYSSATSLNGSDISSHYESDSSVGIFSSYGWWEYNLAGGHQLWPNYRTYLIDTDTSSEEDTPFTLQIIDYYSLGASGSPEIRFRSLLAE
ncbi:MAG: HmuY family protein [Oceanobacter sp.]